LRDYLGACREEEAARRADQSEYRDIGRAAAGAGNWSGYGGEDSPDAQIIARNDIT
jgi:hypothetical protein